MKTELKIKAWLLLVSVLVSVLLALVVLGQKVFEAHQQHKAHSHERKAPTHDHHHKVNKITRSA